MRSYTLCANRFKFITDLEPLFLAHPVHTNDAETANYALYPCTHSPTPMIHTFYAWLAGEMFPRAKFVRKKLIKRWLPLARLKTYIGSLRLLTRSLKTLNTTIKPTPPPCTFITDALRLDFDAKWSTKRSRKWSQHNTKPVFPWVFFYLLAEKWCPGAESNHRHEDFQSTALPLSYPGTESVNALGDGVLW